MNRILQFLDNCDCCRARRARRTAGRFQETAEQFEQAVGGDALIEFVATNEERLQDGEPAEIMFWVNHSPEPCRDLSNASGHIGGELRRLAGLLTEAAEKIERNGGGA